MKLLHAIFFGALIYSVNGYWPLADVFTGLDEAVKEADFNKIGKEIKEKGKSIGDDLLKAVPQMDWCKVTKNFLHKVKFVQVLEQKSNLTMDQIVSRWNNLLKELNNEAGFKDNSEMYQKIKSDLEAILPKELYEKWENKVKSIAGNMKKTMSKFNVQSLKTVIKNWQQPSFMKEETLEHDKEILKETVQAAEEQEKEMASVGERKISRFIKPHHLSGHSKWKKFIDQLPMKNFKKSVPKFPMKNIRNKMKTLMKKFNDQLVVVKGPVKTELSVLDDKNELITITGEDGKKLETLTPDEQKDYEEAEGKWEKEVLHEAERLAEKMRSEEKKATPTAKPTTTTIVTPKMTEILAGNENWEILEDKKVPWDKEDDEDDEDDDYAEDDNNDDFSAIQGTRPKLGKEAFTKRLADQEVEWFNLKKKLMEKLNALSV